VLPVGTQLEILWPEDNMWYPAKVHAYNPQDNKYLLLYGEGNESEWVDFNATGEDKVTWRLKKGGQTPSSRLPPGTPVALGPEGGTSAKPGQKNPRGIKRSRSNLERMERERVEAVSAALGAGAMRQRERGYSEGAVAEGGVAARERLAVPSAAPQASAEEAAPADADDAPVVPLAIAQAKELQWVQCERKGCAKWRRLPPHLDPEELPDTWYCEMNDWDARFAQCAAPEEKLPQPVKDPAAEGGGSGSSNILSGGSTSSLTSFGKHTNRLSYRELIKPQQMGKNTLYRAEHAKVKAVLAPPLLHVGRAACCCGAIAGAKPRT
jgi:hypothetical protein